MGLVILRKKFVNSDLLQTTVRRFYDYGAYTDAPIGTQEWRDFWLEQKERCMNGYQIGDLRITGYHYYYLNFMPMLRVEKDRDPEDVLNDILTADKVEGPPAFWDGDYYFFHSVDRCIKQGKHMVVLKARRKGYSYKIASMFARNWSMKRQSKNFAMASQEEFLLKDGFLTKAYAGINYMDVNTPFYQPRLVNQKLYKQSGYLENIRGTFVEKGTKNEIHGISLKDDPDKARGKAGEIGIFEEAGILKGLKKAWEVCKSSYESGRYTTGLMMAFGTGGAEDADFEGLSEIFYHPEAYGCLAFDNMWDIGARGSNCGYFVPAYQNYEGFIDEHGNSDDEGAKKYLEAERELRKKAKDPDAEAQFISEFPFNPKEATLNLSVNIFPIAELQAHLNNVNANKLWRQVVAGTLYEDHKGVVKFKPETDHPPVYKFPHSKSTDLTGCVTILESPRRGPNGVPEPGSYVLVHDPYAKDQSKERVGMSLGAAYVIKLPQPGDHTLPACIVASYVGRPATQDQYNRNLFLLARFYNARIGFENNRGNVIQYAKVHRQLHYLMPELDILSKRQQVRKNVTSISYGLTMSNIIKQQGEIYLRDWLLEPVITFASGEQKLRLHTIMDPALLEELIRFTFDGNFDRVMALLVGMFYITDRRVKPQINVYRQDPLVQNFFNKPLFV